MLFRSLYRGERVLLEVARGLAVLGAPATAATLARVVETDPDTVDQALYTLSAAGLLIGGFLPHQVVVDAVVSSILPKARAGLFQRAAAVMAETGKPAHVVVDALVRSGDVSAPWARALLLKGLSSARPGEDLTPAVALLEQSLEREDARTRADVRWALLTAELRAAQPGENRHWTPLVAAAVAGDLELGRCAVLVRRLVPLGRTDDAGAVVAALRDRAGASSEVAELEVWLGSECPVLAVPDGLPRAMTSLWSVSVTGLWARAVSALGGALATGRSEATATLAEEVLNRIRPEAIPSGMEEAALVALLALRYNDRVPFAAKWSEEAVAGFAESGEALLAAFLGKLVVDLGELALADVLQRQVEDGRLVPEIGVRVAV